MKYYYDTNARVQAWIEADDREQADGAFMNILIRCGKGSGHSAKITPDNYEPVKEEE